MTNTKDFGKLISKPDLKKTRKDVLEGSVAIMFLGILFTFFAFRKLYSISDLPYYMMFFFMCTVISGFLIFMIGLTFFIKAVKMNVEIFEQGFIDYYYDTGKKRKEIVKAYFIEEYVLYGINVNGEKKRVVRRSEKKIAQRIFDQIVEDLENADIL